MARTAQCSIGGQAYCVYDKGEYTMDTQEYVGNSGSKYYVYILKLTAPAFTGKAKKITFRLNASTIDLTSMSLRFALCTSDANYQSYRNQHGAVTEATQIASGVLEMSSAEKNAMELRELTIETNALRPGTDYYLYLWASSNLYCLGLMDVASAHAAEIAYISGGARINDGGTVKRFPAVIWNGSAWKRYIPVVYTASGWKRQG